MGKKRIGTAMVLAAGLLVSPVQPAPEMVGSGAATAVAKECKLEIELCQEIDLVFYKTRACWTYRAFCD